MCPLGCKDMRMCGSVKKLCEGCSDISKYGSNRWFGNQVKLHRFDRGRFLNDVDRKAKRKTPVGRIVPLVHPCPCLWWCWSASTVLLIFFYWISAGGKRYNGCIAFGLPRPTFCLVQIVEWTAKFGTNSCNYCLWWSFHVGASKNILISNWFQRNLWDLDGEIRHVLGVCELVARAVGSRVLLEQHNSRDRGKVFIWLLMSTSNRSLAFAKL